MNPKKRIWLLGAGFSQSLGGPLLADLFRLERMEELLAYFPESEFGQLHTEIRQVQALFNLGRDLRLWTDAEKFLAYVDDAFEGNVYEKQSLLRTFFPRAAAYDAEKNGSPAGRRWSTELIDSLQVSVRRALAAECSRFVRGTNALTELWSPYVTWVQSLMPTEDVVVGFNYDPVVEHAARAHPGEQVRVRAPIPTESESDPNRVNYYKLHGSCDWLLLDDKCVRGKSAEQVLKSEALTEIAIAPPGGSKARFIERFLYPLWIWTEKALREADEVILVGYSFPATDPRAQSKLLGALASSEKRDVTVRIVLGPEMHAPFAQRVLALIRSTKGARGLLVNGELENGDMTHGCLQVVQHPLWAQDFLLRHESYRASFHPS